MRFAFFPTPLRALALVVPEEEPFTWTLYDALGQTSQRGHGPDLDLSALPKGNYWLQIEYRNRQTLFPVQKL
ncbi:MAG: T9SS type A sorting domain-containing protein [Saprospirales bacterium]|nr:T9SS type A sorting domain-containing protein [Saprospirales bacterium]